MYDFTKLFTFSLDVIFNIFIPVRFSFSNIIKNNKQNKKVPKKFLLCRIKSILQQQKFSNNAFLRLRNGLSS